MASELKITQEHQKYLKILGITARNGDMITSDNVTKAYKKQARNAHPDKGGSAQKFTDLKDALEKMQQAFNTVENHGHGINAWWHATNTHRSRFGANFWAEVDPKSTETKKQEQRKVDGLQDLIAAGKMSEMSVRVLNDKDFNRIKAFKDLILANIIDAWRVRFHSDSDLNKYRVFKDFICARKLSTIEACFLEISHLDKMNGLKDLIFADKMRAFEVKYLSDHQFDKIKSAKDLILAGKISFYQVKVRNDEAFLSAFDDTLHRMRQTNASQPDKVYGEPGKKLHDDLKKTRDEFLRTGDSDKFIHNAKKHVRKAEPVLNKSPVWKQFLLDILNALIFIATLGISYLVTGRLRLFSAEPQVAQTHGVNSVKPGLSPAS